MLAAKTLATGSRLTNLAAFHCQQCLEKCFKAVIEEFENLNLKSHDLIRLQIAADIQLTDDELNLMEIINEVYIDARYPGDLGLLPHGKPSVDEIANFIQFCEDISFKLMKKVENH